MKITDKHFRDWEADTFGFGYGTGEMPILQCLQKFFSMLEDGRMYNYENMQKEFGELSTWLLINYLCHADILEYGTSPRYGWITEKGEMIRDYLAGADIVKVYNMLMDDTEDSIRCLRSHCNCDVPCENPLFK
jgi:hypothetical protein